jgi:hypothetical protein
MSEKAAKYYKLIPIKPKPDVSKVLKSPMPGLVKSVSCSVGDMVFITFVLAINHLFSKQKSLIYGKLCVK